LVFIFILQFFFTVWTNIIFNTCFTAIRAASGTSCNTIGTDCLLTIGASLHAARTYGFITAGTAGGTLLAVSIVAEIAVITVVAAHYVAAFVTRRAIPLLQRDIRAIGAVIIKDALYNHEEITQSALFECRTYGGRALAFAKYVAADMRMGHIFIR
jgi:hypothetical protein